MTLPQLSFDDRSFQELFSEARKRVQDKCPEWTEHNISDPGMTLIELFAWMTDMLVYRLNRVPDKLHVALLDLLGIDLEAPKAADTNLRFELTEPPARALTLKAFDTEVMTLHTGADDPVVFRVAEDFVIPPARLDAYVLHRSGVATSLATDDGGVRPQGAARRVFSDPPQVDEAIYLGFTEPIAQLVIRVTVEADTASGIGVELEDSPLRWEVSASGDTWVPVEVLEDTSGGFNLPRGEIKLQVPATASVTTLERLPMYWLRCRLAAETRSGQRTAGYRTSPRLSSVAAAPVGALVRATHAARQSGEILGFSDETAGQTFTVRHVPALPLDPRVEGLQLRLPHETEWEDWELRESFDESDRDDPHYRFDPASGEVELGPAIRGPDGWEQHGRIPPKGAQLRMSSYRYGGGERGMVAAGKLTVLRKAIPGVASVTNPEAAAGGLDAETLDAGRSRAAEELRARYRAVTAEDFESLAEEASTEVARARCLDPEPGEPICVYLLARVAGRDARMPPKLLLPDDDLIREVAEYLDARRLVGTVVEVAPVPLVGVTVAADVRIERHRAPDRVERDVLDALYRYLNPLTGGDPDGPAEDGWAFGRPVAQGELFGVIEDVPGVEVVESVEIYEADLDLGRPRPRQKPEGARLLLRDNQLPCSCGHLVRVREVGARG